MLLLNCANILINLIINEYFEEHRCVLVLTDGDFDYRSHIPSVKVKMIDGLVDYRIVFNYFGCQGIVIHSNNLTTFVEFETQIRLNMERFNRRRFLIYSTSLSDEFFQLKELNFVSDLLLVVPDQENATFELKTHTYVGASPNGSYLVDKWFCKNQTFSRGVNLYPDKLTNQLGRPLKMATFTYEPYSVVGTSIEDHHGSELRSGVEFGLKYNMTPVPVVNDRDYWGEIYPNWSGNGLLGNLAEDNADIGFSALYTWEYCYHFLDLSKPLVRTGITCLVPAPRLAARWLTPFFSYAPKLWASIIVLLVVAIVVLSFILFCYTRNKTMVKKYGSKKKPYSYIVRKSMEIVLKPIFQQPLLHSETPFYLSSKMMVALVHILGLFFTSTYSSGLATVMTVPRYENAIDTVEDFAQSGLDWGATQDAWITSIQNAEEATYVQIVSKFHPISEEELQEHSRTGLFAFSIERLPFQNFAIGGYIKDDVVGNFHVMQQDLYWEQCVIMLRKNSILLPSLDLFILRIFEAGLISKWQNKAVELFMDPYVQRAVRFYKLHKHEVVKLKWSHVEGPFAILLIGYSTSFVVFVLEVVLPRVFERNKLKSY